MRFKRMNTSISIVCFRARS